MPYVIRILGSALGGVSARDGLFVKDYNPDYRPGGRLDPVGLLTTTADMSEALTFSSQRKAITTYQRRSKSVPFRPDGKPNRPLTAYTVEIIPKKEDE